jgi:hypothetical protein
MSTFTLLGREKIDYETIVSKYVLILLCLKKCVSGGGYAGMWFDVLAWRTRMSSYCNINMLETRFQRVLNHFGIDST